VYVYVQTSPVERLWGRAFAGRALARATRADAGNSGALPMQDHQTMQLLLHADMKDTGTLALAEHLQDRARHALGRFGQRIVLVEAHLRDVNRRPRSGYEIIQCRLSARLGSLEGVVVTERADHAERAVDGVLRSRQHRHNVHPDRSPSLASHA
jgi:hypothetical protein